jgi:aspartate kinase
MKDYDTPSVMKFGGSSFATQAHFGPVCEWIADRLRQRGARHRIVCVVSAPSGLTEQYRDTILSLNPTPPDRLIDAGLPLADSLGAVLTAAALQARGVAATALLGGQIGLRTDRNYTRAHLQAFAMEHLERELEQHHVVVIPGGQAAATDTGETMWMGKNSSDLSAIALAAALGCDTVEIHSDVPGVYSSDPSLVPDAYLLPRLSHRQVEQMSWSGAKVLHHRGVEYARLHGIRIVCRGNHGDFAVGSVLSAEAPTAAAVIPDARSQIFIGGSQDIGRAAEALQAAGVPHVLLPDAAAPMHLCVTCGYFDAPHFLRQRRISLERIDASLLSVVLEDGTVLRELVAPERLAERSSLVHALHCGGGRSGEPLPGQSRPLAQAETPVPMSRRLCVLSAGTSIPSMS